MNVMIVVIQIIKHKYVPTEYFRSHNLWNEFFIFFIFFLKNDAQDTDWFLDFFIH